MTGARRIRGFSLLEMLVALAIVALLVAVLMPNTSLRHERT
jgi:prepilin-type N-terminal cleavage/methylation domain-containing protein